MFNQYDTIEETMALKSEDPGFKSQILLYV